MRDARVAFVLGLTLGLVLGMIAGVLALTASPASAEAVTHVHSSSRYDRSVTSLHREAVRFRHRDVVTWTEIGSRRRALRVPGVRVYAPRPSDLAISWDRSWRLVAKGMFQPTTVTYRRLVNGRLARLYVAWVVIQRSTFRVLVMVAHLPSRVQHGDRFSLGVPRRVDQWRTGVRGWAHRHRVLVRRFSPQVSVQTADWNVDLRYRAWRLRVARPFGLRVTWQPPFPAAGTRNHRLIDGTVTNARGRAYLLRDDASSDHRPYQEVLRHG